MRKSLCLALLLCLVLPAFAREDEAKVKAAVQERFNQWLAAENKRDVASVTNLYDDNAVLLPSKEEPVVGLAAITEWHKRLYADPHFVPFTLAVDRNSFHVVDDIAIETALFQGDATREGKAIHFRGKYLLLWKKQKDGSWKIFRYMYDEIPQKK